MPDSISISDIRGRARWYVTVRWFYVLGIGIPGVGSLLITTGFTQQVMADLWFVAGILAINGLFLASTHVGANRYSFHRWLAVCQIVFDLLIMSATFYLNRGSETPLLMLFAIPIVMTAAFFGTRAVYATGLSATAIFVILSFLDFTQILPVQHIAAPQLHTDPGLFYPPLVTVVATMLAITFITDLVGRLIRMREQLEQQMEALTDRQAETEAILRTMGSALVAVSKTGKITLVNNSFEMLTGWKRSDVVGRPLDDILPILDEHGKRVPVTDRPMMQFKVSDSPAVQPAVRALSGFSYRRKDGSIFSFAGNVAPIIAGGRTIGMTTVFDDVTETKKLDRLKDNFIALISHQLKTPVGEINGYAYNLLGGIGGTLNAKQTEYVTHIQELAARAGKLIVDLLDIVLAGEGNLAVNNEPTELGPIVELVAKLHKEHITQKRLKLEVKLPQELLFVRGDDHKLIQVLGNLLDNAISYSKRGTITLSVVPANDIVEVFVSDQGGGMEQATIDALFGGEEQGSIFSKAPTAEGGTGLGVHLARELVALMGGTIHLVSSTKRGTTICVTLHRMKP